MYYQSHNAKHTTLNKRAAPQGKAAHVEINSEIMVFIMQRGVNTHQIKRIYLVLFTKLKGYTGMLEQYSMNWAQQSIPVCPEKLGQWDIHYYMNLIKNC